MARIISRTKWWRSIGALMLLSLGTPITSTAVEPDSSTVGTLFNWYYATSFGTGVYTIGDTTVTVVALQYHYTLREPSENHWGWRVTVPITAAVGNFDLYNPDFGQIDRIQLAAMGIMPGIELVVPLRQHWRYSLFANIGRAWEFESKAGATIYQAGMSTHYRVPTMHDPDFELGAKYIYAGYTSNGTDSAPVSLASVGFASSLPLPWTLSTGRQTRLGIHMIGTSYLTNIRFQLPEFGYTEIHGELAAGVTLGLRPALNILGTTWDRVGLSYVRGSNGLRGIRLVTDFPF